MNDLLSILIPTYNRKQVLAGTLKQLRARGYDRFPWLIYDDGGSGENRLDDLCGEYGNLTLYRGESCRGQSYGRTFLLEHCATPFVCMMEDDTFFLSPPEALLNLMERDLAYPGIPGVGVVCSQIIRTYDRACWFREEWTEPVQVAWMPGSGTLCRTQALREAGGYRRFFKYRHEETEFSLRLWQKDYAVVYDPGLRIEHVHTPVARSGGEYDFLSARNLILMHYLNFRGFYGMPRGVLRAIRLLFCKSTCRSSVVRGIGAGIADAARYRSERSCMDRGHVQSYRTFLKQCR